MKLPAVRVVVAWRFYWGVATWAAQSNANAKIEPCRYGMGLAG